MERYCTMLLLDKMMYKHNILRRLHNSHRENLDNMTLHHYYDAKIINEQYSLTLTILYAYTPARDTTRRLLK